MSLAKNFKMMSLYNQRINTQLLGCCLNLSNEVLNKDTNSFFPSIIAYWNHLLFGDLILLSRIASNDIAQLNDQALSIFPSPKSLAKLREQVDVVIVDYCANLTDEACGKLITYTTTEGELITKVVADITQHLFNHQTHHRGQLTCVLSQSGVNYGCMDLPVIVPEGSS